MNTNEKFNADGYKVAHNEREAQEIIADLWEREYRRIANSFWYEIWKFGSHTFTIERDF